MIDGEFIRHPKRKLSFRPGERLVKLIRLVLLLEAERCHAEGERYAVELLDGTPRTPETVAYIVQRGRAYSGMSDTLLSLVRTLPETWYLDSAIERAWEMVQTCDLSRPASLHTTGAK